MRNSLICALLASTGLAAAASRPAERNCEWKKMAGKKAGLEFLYQKCDFGYRTQDFVEKADGFYEVLHDTDGAHPDSVNQVIAVYSKPKGETIEAAIRRLFFTQLDEYKQKHCVVKEEPQPFLPPDRKAYTIAADAEYQKKIDKTTPEGDMPDPPCGEHGFQPDSSTYFEYHPAEDKGKFLFILFGQEANPEFDEKSLKFVR